MDVSAVIEFVQAHGSPVEHARLAYLLDRTQPSPAITSALFAGQRSDGGWAPFWANDYSALDATCFRLAQAEALGLISHTTESERALEFVRERQCSDGSWQESPPAGVALPPWLTPDDPASIAYLTANCGLWLTIRNIDHAGSMRAAEYLRIVASADDTPLPFGHTIWLAAALWFACQYTSQAERALERLDTDAARLSASDLAWALTSLHVGGVPAQHEFVRRSVRRLQSLQRADGSWASADGPAQDVHTTLEVLRVICRVAHAN